MTCSAEYAPQLRALGFRVTSQRLAILHVMRHAPGHLSPKDVFTQARRVVPGITPTTVYRTLDFLRRSGLVWQSSRPKGHLAYELAEGEHHHLVCRTCGREVELPQAVIEVAYKKMEAISGYAIDHEHTNLTGVCPRCRLASSRQ